MLHIATTRIMPLHIGKGRTVGTAISNIIDYVENPDQTDSGRLITGYQCDSRIADAEYDISALLAVLSGKRTHTPSTKNVHRADPPKVNLLVDIQAKLRDGKGAGYARWASVFNLKQMAQTMNYLTEHGLLDYADLAAKAAAATERYNGLSEKIKAAERRMAEIAVLKTHIINYSKTRDVYIAYRKAGYSKKFKAEHESEILLHQAAKKFLMNLG